LGVANVLVFFNHLILFEKEYEFQQKHILCGARGYVMYLMEWLIRVSINGTVRIYEGWLISNALSEIS